MTIETNILSANKLMGCIVVLVSYYVIDVVNVFCILFFFKCLIKTLLDDL